MTYFRPISSHNLFTVTENQEVKDLTRTVTQKIYQVDQLQTNIISQSELIEKLKERFRNSEEPQVKRQIDHETVIYKNLFQYAKSFTEENEISSKIVLELISSLPPTKELEKLEKRQNHLNRYFQVFENIAGWELIPAFTPIARKHKPKRAVDFEKNVIVHKNAKEKIPIHLVDESEEAPKEDWQAGLTFVNRFLTEHPDERITIVACGQKKHPDILERKNRNFSVVKQAGLHTDRAKLKQLAHPLEPNAELKDLAAKALASLNAKKDSVSIQTLKEQMIRENFVEIVFDREELCRLIVDVMGAPSEMEKVIHMDATKLMEFFTKSPDAPFGLDIAHKAGDIFVISYQRYPSVTEQVILDSSENDFLI